MHPVVSAYRSFSRRPSGCVRLSTIGRRGAVALITALCAPILVLIVGFTADFAYASYINQQLARATDDATVGSVSQTAATAAGGYGNVSYLHDAGVNIFNANIAQLPATTGVNFKLSVVPDGQGGAIASGSYTLNVPTFFSAVLGYDSIPVSGSAKTSAKPLVYVNYYILVDASQSMGIASTAAAMTKLYNLVVSNKSGSGSEAGCVFGCHVISSNQKTVITNEALAHTNNVELRIDAAVTAVKSIITQAQAIAGSSQNIKFGLYTIQQDPITHSLISVIASPSTDYTALQAAAATIDLGNNTSGGVGDSDFPDELVTFNKMLTASGVVADGVGTSATSPMNYFLILTDGMADVAGSCTYGHCTNAMDPAGCTQLKTKGTVGVVYTTYVPIYNKNDPSQGFETDYNTLVAPYSSQIAPNLQKCVSSSKFYFRSQRWAGHCFGYANTFPTNPSLISADYAVIMWMRSALNLLRTVLRGRRGSVTVEFALIATPFIFMVFALIEGGLILVASVDLSNATMALGRQLRTGNLMATGAAAKTSGVVMSLSDFKTAICNQMALIPTATCTNQLQVDIRTQSAFGSGQSAANPVSNGTFNTSSLCYFSGIGGSIVEFRAFYLWPVTTPLLYDALVDASAFKVGNTTTTGNYHVIVSSEAFKIEQNAAGNNAGGGC